MNRPPSFGSKASFPGVNPDVYEYLEAERIKYAIRLLANQVRLDGEGLARGLEDVDQRAGKRDRA